VIEAGTYCTACANGRFPVAEHGTSSPARNSADRRKRVTVVKHARVPEQDDAAA